MKYYEGSELKWSVEDILRYSENLEIELTEEQAESILMVTFKDNTYIMDIIGEAITDSILTFNALRKNEQ
jgi:hypothetical protein